MDGLGRTGRGRFPLKFGGGSGGGKGVPPVEVTDSSLEEVQFDKFDMTDPVGETDDDPADRGMGDSEQ